MEFEWDEDKRAANLEKQGIDFADAAAIWKQPVIDRYASRVQEGEIRLAALGLHSQDELIIAVV